MDGTDYERVLLGGVDINEAALGTQGQAAKRQNSGAGELQTSKPGRQ
jgi:hypothetical protein